VLVNVNSQHDWGDPMHEIIQEEHEKSLHTTIIGYIHSNSKTLRKVVSGLIQGKCRSSRTNRVIKVSMLGDSTG